MQPLDLTSKADPIKFIIKWSETTEKKTSSLALTMFFFAFLWLDFLFNTSDSFFFFFHLDLSFKPNFNTYK